MQPIRKPPTLRVQLQDLLLMELTNWRWSWQSTVLTSTVAPILGIVALGSIASTSQDTNAYILTGNLVMSLMFGNLNNARKSFYIYAICWEFRLLCNITHSA